MGKQVTSNLSSVFKKSSQTIGHLNIPLIGLQMGIPLSFDVAPIDSDLTMDEARMLAEVSGAIAVVADKLAVEVKAALSVAIRSSVWAWKDGIRNIYDTGELERSVDVQVTNNGITVAYGAPYANLVHNGGYVRYPYGNRNARPVYMPPRPWVASVLYGGGPVPQFDFNGFIERNMRVEFCKGPLK